jgi:hypothetical protein
MKIRDINHYISACLVEIFSKYLRNVAFVLSKTLSGIARLMLNFRTTAYSLYL